MRTVGLTFTMSLSTATLTVNGFDVSLYSIIQIQFARRFGHVVLT